MDGEESWGDRVLCLRRELCELLRTLQPPGLDRALAEGFVDGSGLGDFDFRDSAFSDSGFKTLLLVPLSEEPGP